MARKKSTRDVSPGREMEPTDADLAERFDNDIAALIRVAETRLSGPNMEQWGEIALRLERTRSYVREMMTPKARGRIK